MGDKMKKALKFFILTILILGSFYTTDQIVTIMKNRDPIMIEINKLKDEYYEEAFNAYLISNNQVIPGYNGIKIDVNKSYYVMKEKGKFDVDLLVLKETTPEKTIWNYKEKIIKEGNPKKEGASIIFYLNENEEIEEHFKLLIKYDLKATFFISKNWLNKNKVDAMRLYINGHELEINATKKEEIVSTKNDINTLTMNKPLYVSNEKKEYDVDFLKTIDNAKTKFVLPTVFLKELSMLSNNSLKLELIKKISAGVIIHVPNDEKLDTYLNVIKEVAKVKKLKIMPLKEHLSSNR
jgi:hypothetical protein